MVLGKSICEGGEHRGHTVFRLKSCLIDVYISCGTQESPKRC